MKTSPAPHRSKFVGLALEILCVSLAGSLGSSKAFALPAPTSLNGGLNSAPPSTSSTMFAQVNATNSRSPGAPVHIMIDPGHGGVDKGAVRGNLKEAEIALRVSRKLAELLRADSRFKVSMTRETDHTLSLQDRTRLATEAKVDLFLSIHLNSSTDPRAHGKEFYFQNQLPVDEELMFIASRENLENENKSAEGTQTAQEKKNETFSSKQDVRRILEDLKRNERIYASSELSQTLHQSWVNSGKNRRAGSRAIRQAPFYVVSNVNVPSVLVELGFLSHPQEGQKLNQASYQAELAESLYSGLINFKETMDKDRAETLNSANAN